MSLIKKLAGETAIYGISSILSRLLNYVLLTPFFTRIFSTVEYGGVSILFTYAAFLMILFTYRMETAFFRFGSKPRQLETAFSTASISLVVSTSIFVLLGHLGSEQLTRILGFEGHKEYILLLLWLIAFDALAAIPFARLRLDNRPLSFAFIKTLNIVINVVAAYFFLRWLPDWIASGNTSLGYLYREDNRIIYVFISQLIASIITFVYLAPAYAKMQWRFDFGLWKQMYRYALPLIVVGVAAVVNSLIAIPLLKELLPGSSEQNQAVSGLYGAIAKLAILMNLFTQAFNYAAEPFFFRHASRSDARQIYADVGQAFALVGSVVFLGIMLYLDIVQLFLGQAFRTGLEIVPILLLANFCLGLYYNFSIWYKLTDQTRIGGYISIAGVVITLTINVVGIPLIGYSAPAWAALACYGFMALTSFYIGRRFYPIPYPMLNILGYILLAIGVWIISKQTLEQLMMHPLGIKMLVNTLFLVGYGVLIYCWEKKTIHRLIKA
ncbi:MAG: polysaccharide biosynthesis C-terminal domain-containing protein [Bacteroidota bacterium]